MNINYDTHDVSMPIVLKGNHDPTLRASFLTTLINLSETKVNHFDSIRQRILLISLAIFAGLSSFTLQGKGNITSIFSSISLSTLMIVLARLDFVFHKYSKGYQKAKIGLTHSLTVVLNSPEEDVLFWDYDMRGESEVKFFGLIRILYLFLVAGGVGSYIASLFV